MEENRKLRNKSLHVQSIYLQQSFQEYALGKVLLLIALTRLLTNERYKRRNIIQFLINQHLLNNYIERSILGGFPGGSLINNPLANAGNAGSTSVREDPTCCGVIKVVCRNYWACALEPGNHNYRALVPQLLKPAHSRGCILQQEKLPQWKACTQQLESSPHFPEWEKSLHSNKDTTQPKINKWKSF